MLDHPASQIEPVIIPRDRHQISRANIADNALKVLYRLRGADYGAYLVGGGVRDLSLGREPKDFDVATDATPEELRALFRNCRLIGRRFRLAHVHFGREIVEVATFRALHLPEDEPQEDAEPADSAHHVNDEGRVLRDNVYGTIAEDALRRDFTINALYYNIADYSVVDYAGGMADVEQGLVRLIGDPAQRYREDPVRMLRAVRFAVKLGFRIEPATAEAIRELAPLLEDIPAARLFEEVLKLFADGQALESFEMLRHYDLMRYLFPMTEGCLERDEHGVALDFVSRALDNTDRRVAEGKPITPAFLFAALLWPPVSERAAGMWEEASSPTQAMQEAGAEVLADQVRQIVIPKRFGMPMREIWNLQPRLERRSKRRAQRLLGHPRFRAAYDFLVLRAAAGELDQSVADWWTQLQADNPERAAARPAPRRRRGGRDAGGGDDATSREG